MLDDAAVFKLVHSYQPDAAPASRIEDWIPPQYLPVSAPTTGLNARIAELDESHRIACLCHHGARSQRVAAFLAQNGFAEVANVAGGIDAWSAERDPAVPRY
ncbi:MAG: hypothetical protein KKC85_14185 [Gammaproteobacteria bacterium]|nr:hypothetical protein [Gammaproteobacteria bacterium]